MEPDAALPRAESVIILDPEALEDLHRAIVHAHGHGYPQLPHGLAQHRHRGGVQVEYVCACVDLSLDDIERIQRVRPNT